MGDRRSQIKGNKNVGNIHFEFYTSFGKATLN